jgi:hypothetical protein
VLLVWEFHFFNTLLFPAALLLLLFLWRRLPDEVTDLFEGLQECVEAELIVSRVVKQLLKLGVDRRQRVRAKIYLDR